MERIETALKGVLIGDSLGLKSQFENPQRAKEVLQNLLEEIYENGKKDFLGWSDDGALTLATAEALAKNPKDPYGEIAKNFLQWYLEGVFTPDGIAIDIGRTTSRAMENLKRGIPPLEAGGRDEWDNGNGSLMRILPASIYSYYKFPREAGLEFVHNISAITHAHPRSKVACGIYTFVVWKLLEGLPKGKAYIEGVKEALEFYQNHPYGVELKHFERVLNPEILLNLSEEDLGRGFYVVEALENSLWSFLKGDTFKGVLVKAISLGGDTDTVGAIAGGLAGLYYGIEIPLWEAVKGRKTAEVIIKGFSQTLNRI